MLSVVMVIVVMLSFVIMIVIMLTVVVLSVVTPSNTPGTGRDNVTKNVIIKVKCDQNVL